MARIIGAHRHLAHAHHRLRARQNKQDDPVWAPIFEAYEPMQQWLAEKKPDVLLIIYNDHVTSFFFDHYSAFALGIGETYARRRRRRRAARAAAGERRIRRSRTTSAPR